MKKFVILIFVLLLNNPRLAFSQTTDAARAQVETMLTALAPGKIDVAIKAFAQGSLIAPSLIDQTVSQAKSVITPDRPVLGFELLQEQNAGASVKRLTYVLKLSDRPLFWNFSFYKPTNDWIPLRMYFAEEP